MEVMESTFAVDPEGRDERDGWLMTTVCAREGDTGHVAVMDARRLSDGPVAWIDLPHRPASAFHATWLPDVACKPGCAVCAADEHYVASEPAHAAEPEPAPYLRAAGGGE
jgi:hypothetical protein